MQSGRKRKKKESRSRGLFLKEKKSSFIAQHESVFRREEKKEALPSRTTNKEKSLPVNQRRTGGRGKAVGLISSVKKEVHPNP